ncbi:DNA endonuclease SmrA [Lacimicrobium alkaliphilum]|uniref:Smr domain-containing protein n=1 Tax=Lacimicrobium alkaliphilum TaxID=1526571 RepID=A0ABQ1RQ16_9ALTE|nr:DNA endonuclease SmrA [Lacimicrobium alkaliphilum]GGD74876.1 hypothetical protein GCM10011357_32320 [Lacimicrobium alkaliphilum]
MGAAKQDQQAFLDAMQDVRPIAANDKVVHQVRGTETLAQRLKRQALEKAASQNPNILSIEKVESVEPDAFLEFKKHGVQEGVYKKLRLGKYRIDDVLNIRRMKFEQAREQMFDSLTQAHDRGVRTLLIQHGMGIDSKPFPAFLKSYVNQWLRQLPQVLAFHTAQRAHGGLAATYVLLQKNQRQKQTNRELHQKPR